MCNFRDFIVPSKPIWRTQGANVHFMKLTDLIEIVELEKAAGWMEGG